MKSPTSKHKFFDLIFCNSYFTHMCVNDRILFKKKMTLVRVLWFVDNKIECRKDDCYTLKAKKNQIKIVVIHPRRMFAILVLDHVWKDLYLVRDIKPPNNQSCFLQFFHELFSVWADEKEMVFCCIAAWIQPYQFDCLRDFLFQIQKLRKIHGKSSIHLHHGDADESN